MGRFLRSKKSRALLWYAAGGKCALCGTELTDGWHADHIVPWVKSRRTNVHEMQALCAICNERKGASNHMVVIAEPHGFVNLAGYRPGQEASHTRVMEIFSEYLACRWNRPSCGGVLPCGYGKRCLIHGLAVDAVHSGFFSCVLVLNDTEFLRDQMVDADNIKASLDFLGIRPELLRYKAIKQSGNRYAANGEILLSATIQLVANNMATSFEPWVESMFVQTGKPVLVIADEGESMASRKSWGAVLGGLQKAGAFVLSLTATPYRDDGDEIVGFESELLSREEVERVIARPGSTPEKVLLQTWAGTRSLRRIIPDFGWTWKEAWKERPSHICDLDLQTFDVALNEIDKLGIVTGKALLSELSASNSVGLLSRIVRHPPAIRHGVEMFVRAIREERAMGPQYADVAGVVYTANDEGDATNEHAEAIKRAIHRTDPGLRVVIATTAEDGVADTKGIELLKAFVKNGAGDVLIVKQMAGKGMDSPRIKVILDLSPIRTLRSNIQRWNRANRPYHRAMVGRVIAPKDALTVAYWEAFVKENGGDARHEELSFVKEREVDREESTPPRYMPTAALDADVGDTRGQWEPTIVHAARRFIERFPMFLERFTWPDVIQHVRALIAEGWQPPEPEAVALDSGSKMEEDKGQAGDYVAILTNVWFLRRHGRSYRKAVPGDGERFSEIRRELWARVYRAAGVPRGMRLKDIEEIAMAERVRDAAETLYREETAVDDPTIDAAGG
jgi:hypothetical protein